MIDSDFKYQKFHKNFFILINSYSDIKEVLMSKKFFKKNVKLKFNFLSWNNITNDDSNKNNKLSSDSWASLIISFKTQAVIRFSDKLLMSDALSFDKTFFKMSYKFLSKLNLINKISNKNSYQSELMMFKVFESENDCF